MSARSVRRRSARLSAAAPGINPQHGHCSIFGGFRNVHLMHFLGSASLLSARSSLALFAIVEFVVVDVGDEAQPDVVVGVVEDQAVGLAVRGAQPAADHLHEQDFGLWSAAPG